MAPQQPQRKSLLVTFHDPECVTYGAGQRTHLLARALYQNAAMDIAYFDAQVDSVRQRPLTGELGTGTLYTFPIDTRHPIDSTRTLLRSRHLSRLLNQHIDLRRYDVIVTRYITPAMKLAFPKGVPVVVDFDDPIYRTTHLAGVLTPQMLLSRFNEFLGRWHLASSLARRRKYLFISRQDAAFFPKLKAYLLPNIPLPPALPCDPAMVASPPTLLFVGYLNWQPNIEAVDNFVRHVWPEVHRVCPTARLRIAGKCPEEIRRRLAEVPGCEALGFVQDLDAVYREANICVVPLKSGGGSNIKLPEACAHGRAVVAFRYAYQAWSDWLSEGEELLVADDNAAFAQRCIELLQNPSSLIRIARKGHTQVNLHLNFKGFSRMLSDALAS